MPEKAVVVVQLVHIEGPLKGKIEESTDAVIGIGRLPECRIRFPADLTIVSRDHAEIVRESDRFKLIDHSTNGTFVNGKKVREAILKNGDVLTLGDGGPKISFLTETRASAAAPRHAANTTGQEATVLSQPSSISPPAFSSVPRESPQAVPPSPVQPDAPEAPAKPSSAAAPSRPEPAPQAHEASVQAPLVIQFGPTIQSFRMLPVVVGKGKDCDFIISQAHIGDRHIQIFFHAGKYWVRDLTGRNLISINDTPVQSKAPLHPGIRLSLGPRGPVFQFLDGGRLAQVEESDTPPVEQPISNILPGQAASHQPLSQPRQGKRGWMLPAAILLLVLAATLVWVLFLRPGSSPLAAEGGFQQWLNRLWEMIQRPGG